MFTWLSHDAVMISISTILVALRFDTASGMDSDAGT
jgi:hypothetical protein